MSINLNYYSLLVLLGSLEAPLQKDWLPELGSTRLVYFVGAAFVL